MTVTQSVAVPATDIPPLPTSTRIAFGVGSASDSLHSISFTFFCFFYYVQVLEVPGTLVGLATGIVVLLDAVTDPLVGMLSDRLRSRLGRRHPLMFASALPLGFCFMALFAPPSGQSDAFLALWLFVFASGTRTALTFFSLPHLALGAELDPDRLGRTRTMSWHAAFLWVGGASCHFLGLTFFFDGPRAPGSGMLNADAYPIYGLVWGVVFIVLILCSSLLTLSRIRYLPKATPNEAYNIKSLFGDYKEIFTNQNYLWLVGGLLLYAVTSGIHEAFSSHLALYFFEFESSQFRYYGVGAFFGYLVGFFITIHLHRRLGKVRLLAISTFLSAVASSAPIWLRMAGLFPENNTPYVFPCVITFVTLFYFMQSMLFISIMSLLGDIADEHELRWGRRREGVLYASRSSFGKVASALGTFVAGIMLDLIRFPLGADIVPGQVDSGIIYNMGLNYGVVATVPALLAGLVYLRCGMTADYHDEVLKKLATKKLATKKQAVAALG